jgi:adenylate cyclase, class 2
VPIEAELKARVRDSATLRKLLDQRAAGETSVYHDTYYDDPSGTLTTAGRELRVRTITSHDGSRVLLTYKAPAADEESGSKPEYETTAGDAGTLDAILTSLGYVHLVAFEKHCTNYTFTSHGRRMLATLVTVLELDGTFLEVETLAAADEVDDALRTVRRVMDDLGIDAVDLTTEQYTEAVLAARSGRHLEPHRHG